MGVERGAALANKITHANITKAMVYRMLHAPIYNQGLIKNDMFV